MYSILIKNGNSTYIYATDETTGEPFAGSLADTKTKFNELIQKYPVSKLIVVHNTTLTVDLNIEDVQ